MFIAMSGRAEKMALDSSTFAFALWWLVGRCVFCLKETAEDVIVPNLVFSSVWNGIQSVMVQCKKRFFQGWKVFF